VYFQDCIKISPEGQQSKIEVVYIRGSQISFIVLPSMLQKAPFFNRIKLFRKFKGNAVFGANILTLPGRGPIVPSKNPLKRGPPPSTGFSPYGPPPSSYQPRPYSR
jgi:hypothetical protein